MASFESDAMVFNPSLNNNGCLDETIAYSRKPLIHKMHDLRRILKLILVHQLIYSTPVYAMNEPAKIKMIESSFQRS